jgi:UDP-N-acetylmuramoyl-L-alanyl-D-glutamate--2,6-diaminopimelate ligase
MKLTKLFLQASSIEIGSLMSDSRHVQNHALFFCLKGMKHDGHQHIAQAVENGAVAIVHSDELSTYLPFVEYIKVHDVHQELNRCAAAFYQFPSEKLKIFGVTGTNGKTTVSKIIKSVYTNHANTGYIGTIGLEYNGVITKPDYTTPEVIALHDILHRMVSSKVKALAIELSSQGLEQHRVDALKLSTAIFTNLTHDHLDYHGTMENYFQAKKHIFDLLKPEGVALINKDDAYGVRLINELTCRKKTYAIDEPADFRASNILYHGDHTTFDLTVEGNVYAVTSSLLGRFNVHNALAALGCCVLNGMPIREAVNGLANIPQVSGRLEHVQAGQSFRIIVDYAHTPDGFEKVFTYAQAITPRKNKIIAVFGSAGLRDSKKRPVLGALADRYCDNIILTEDDCRSEDPAQIAQHIASGITTNRSLVILDRTDAIRQALELANRDDTVLLLGKGHEDFIIRAHGKDPWPGDVAVSESLLRQIADEKENLYDD